MKKRQAIGGLFWALSVLSQDLYCFFTLKEKNAKAAQKSGIGALCMVIACAFVLLIILLYKLNLDPVFHQVPGIF